jgi:uncharacterized protein (TIGR00255 family)
MTGFAQHIAQLEHYQVQVELRSVNSRFLDLTFKMPDELRHLENALREPIVARLQRGKVECRVGYRRQASAAKADVAVLDETVLESLKQAQSTLLERLPTAKPLSIHELLRWPGLLPETQLPESLDKSVLESLTRTLDAFVQSRAQEGQSLVQFLRSRLDHLETLMAPLKANLPQLVQAQEKKILERLEQSLFKPVEGQPGPLALIPADESMARIRQEVALYGIKVDVAEEMNRLETHLTECRAILTRPGPCGKRLDFMVQELNREANTLGSKSVALGQSQIAVELKVTIEQIREQVQNLE